LQRLLLGGGKVVVLALFDQTAFTLKYALLGFSVFAAPVTWF
jgi:hypothetical protein